MSTPALVEDFFRRDYGRLVAILTRRAGAQHVELVEDAVQRALMTALTAWTAGSVPADPSGWLYKVAYRQLIQDLRQQATRARTLQKSALDLTQEHDDPIPPLADEIQDDMLRMLFVCCDDSIPNESQRVLALKVLCGFSTAEIALRLFTSEANVQKRLSRARDRLREASPDFDLPPPEQLQSRLAAVHSVLYLLFNEGYLSASPDQAIRRELCDEAVRLATLVAEHRVGAVPESFALLALMHFHVARLGSRLDDVGELVLLEEQDRSSWDRERIQVGMQWLERSARGATCIDAQDTRSLRASVANARCSRHPRQRCEMRCAVASPGSTRHVRTAPHVPEPAAYAYKPAFSRRRWLMGDRGCSLALARSSCPEEES